MGKSFKQRLQNLFSCSSPTPRQEKVHVVVSSPPYYFHSSKRPYFTAESVVGIRDISGIDLVTVSAVTRPERYHVPTVREPLQKTSMFRRLFSRFRPEERRPKTVEDVIVRGTLCQDSIGPLFINRQCTTMAYESLAYQATRGHPETWTSDDIDAILRLGHRQHSRFRLVDQLSTSLDEKVGAYQLPETYQVRALPEFRWMGNYGSNVMGNGVTATSLPSVDGCLKYETKEMAKELSGVYPEFSTFMANTFEGNPKTAVSIVLTIGEFSMAVWRRADDSRFWLFDSHRRGPRGDNHVIPTVTEPSDPGAALMRSFQNLDALMAHLIGQAGDNFTFSAALVGHDVK